MIRSFVRSKYAPLIPFVSVAALAVALLLLTILAYEAADTFSPGDKSASQDAFQTIGDLLATATYVSFALMLPLAFVSSLILTIRSILRRHRAK